MSSDGIAKIEIPRVPKDPKPRRPSYDNVARDIAKWANSVGLQKPANDLGPDPHAACDGLSDRLAGATANETRRRS
ncbi:MAG TPA: hypothetical protein VMM15_19405 [Bradyrhizobium sp.]|nr:hypothetical protein [Bradyrhizobium sp.]